MSPTEEEALPPQQEDAPKTVLPTQEDEPTPTTGHPVIPPEPARKKKK